MYVIAATLLLIGIILSIVYLIIDKKSAEPMYQDKKKECEEKYLLDEQEEEKIRKSIIITSHAGDTLLYNHADNTFKDNVRIEITCDADSRIMFFIYIIISGNIEIKGMALERYILSKEEYGYLTLDDTTVIAIGLRKEDVRLMEQINYISCLAKNNKHNMSIILSDKEKNIIRDMIAYYNTLI